MRSRLMARDERREGLALLRAAERVAWVTLGLLLGYLLGMLHP